mmetsp:Transcript_45764/g.97762  ORF Transcript_45764/g.97762 Transcript_45764/m.97762 type:complete len:634 (+) Transcript_45764:501-2402(+)
MLDERPERSNPGTSANHDDGGVQLSRKAESGRTHAGQYTDTGLELSAEPPRAHSTEAAREQLRGSNILQSALLQQLHRGLDTRQLLAEHAGSNVNAAWGTQRGGSDGKRPVRLPCAHLQKCAQTHFRGRAQDKLPEFPECETDILRHYCRQSLRARQQNVQILLLVPLQGVTNPSQHCLAGDAPQVAVGCQGLPHRARCWEGLLDSLAGTRRSEAEVPVQHGGAAQHGGKPLHICRAVPGENLQAVPSLEFQAHLLGLEVHLHSAEPQLRLGLLAQLLHCGDGHWDSLEVEFPQGVTSLPRHLRAAGQALGILHQVDRQLLGCWGRVVLLPGGVVVVCLLSRTPAHSSHRSSQVVQSRVPGLRESDVAAGRCSHQLQRLAQGVDVGPRGFLHFLRGSVVGGQHNNLVASPLQSPGRTLGPHPSGKLPSPSSKSFALATSSQNKDHTPFRHGRQLLLDTSLRKIQWPSDVQALVLQNSHGCLRQSAHHLIASLAAGAHQGLHLLLHLLLPRCFLRIIGHGLGGHVLERFKEATAAPVVKISHDILAVISRSALVESLGSQSLHVSVHRLTHGVKIGVVHVPQPHHCEVFPLQDPSLSGLVGDPIVELHSIIRGVAFAVRGHHENHHGIPDEFVG